MLTMAKPVAEPRCLCLCCYCSALFSILAVVRLSFGSIFDTCGVVPVFLLAPFLILVVVRLPFCQLYSQYLWWFASERKFPKFIPSWQCTLNTDNFQALKAWDISYFKCVGLRFFYALVLCLFLILVVVCLFLVIVSAYQLMK